MGTFYVQFPWWSRWLKVVANRMLLLAERGARYYTFDGKRVMAPWGRKL